MIHQTLSQVNLEKLTSIELLDAVDHKLSLVALTEAVENVIGQFGHKQNKKITDRSRLTLIDIEIREARKALASVVDTKESWTHYLLSYFIRVGSEEDIKDVHDKYLACVKRYLVEFQRILTIAYIKDADTIHRLLAISFV